MHEEFESILNPQFYFCQDLARILRGLENHSKQRFFFKFTKDKQKYFLNNKIIFLNKIIIRKLCQRIGENSVNYKLPNILSKN